MIKITVLLGFPNYQQKNILFFLVCAFLVKLMHILIGFVVISASPRSKILSSQLTKQIRFYEYIFFTVPILSCCDYFCHVKQELIKFSNCAIANSYNKLLFSVNLHRT